MGLGAMLAHAFLQQPIKPNTTKEDTHCMLVVGQPAQLQQEAKLVLKLAASPPLFHL